MPRKELLKAIAAAPLPAGLRACLVAAACSKEKSAAKDALRRDAAGFLSGIADLLRRSSALLGLPEEDVLFASGFNPNDTGPGRFEAALAELSAAIELSRLGYTGLALLPQAGRRSADLTARRDGQDYFFEVRCVGVGKDSPLEYLYTGAKPHPKAAEYLRQKYQKKILQASASGKRKAGSVAGVIIVIAPLRPGLNQSALSSLSIPTKPGTTLIIKG